MTDAPRPTWHTDGWSSTSCTVNINSVRPRVSHLWTKRWSVTKSVLRLEGAILKWRYPDTEIHIGSPCLPEGWACLESIRETCYWFNSKERRYLEEKFKHWESTGIIANPDEVSKEMRCLRDQSGQRIFMVKEFLRPQPITSFFSTMACKRRMPPTPMMRLKNLRGSRRLYIWMWWKCYGRKSLIPCFLWQKPVLDDRVRDWKPQDHSDAFHS